MLLTFMTEEWFEDRRWEKFFDNSNAGIGEDAVLKSRIRRVIEGCIVQNPLNRISTSDILDLLSGRAEQVSPISVLEVPNNKELSGDEELNRAVCNILGVKICDIDKICAKNEKDDLQFPFDDDDLK